MSILTNLTNGSRLNPEDILGLLQEMNHEKNLEEGLKVVTRRSLDIFNSAMAGIWLWRDEEFQSLAISARDNEQEHFLNDTIFPADFRMFQKDGLGAQECLQRKMILQDIGRISDTPDGFTGPFYSWKEKLLEFGIKRLLCVPLLHFGQLLGVLTLFSSENDSFDELSVRWLNQLIPLISSSVYEQQLLLAAWDKEQALTLLLRGTEILVQADSEEQLLTEAGEMAMEILYLEAGFFLMQDGDKWQVRAPFGRLKHNETNWTDEVLKIVNSSESYLPQQNFTLRSFGEDSASERFPFQWKKILIEPLRTHSGVVGELWLMDSRAKALEQRQEILGAFVRGLGVALETIRQRRELERLASTDRLTGILNRQGFEQRIHEEMAGTSRRNSSFVFLILDLDGFKHLNDTKGHPVGDAALRKLAQNLRLSVREEDIVARTGGDEFTLVLTDLKKSPGTIDIIERLRENMGLEEYGLGVSIGVAEFPRETSTYEGLYRLADQRLYEGKNSGKGKIVTGE
ncbi:MAG: sensor domain-containing diguanylate cyclase [Desulfitobacteriaceae bacterium]